LTHHISLSGVIYDVCIDQHKKFEVPSFINSKDMIGAKFEKRVM